MKSLLCVGLAALALVPPARAEDWNQWRGPRRDGHVRDFKAPAVWPKTLVKKWSISAGEGHSSPLLVGNRAYVLVRRGEQEHTLCLDAATGKTVWENKVSAPFDSVIFPAQRLGKSPRSTPLLHQGKLYTIGVNGLLTAFDAAQGTVLWRKDFSKNFKIPMPVCGASLSPLVVGKKLYIHVGHEAVGEFLALDKDTGATLWSWKGEGPAYTSPQLATIGGVSQLVTASHNMWIGLSAESGKLLWSASNRQNMFNHNSITPILVGDTLYGGANQRPTFAMKIVKKGEAFVTEPIWETRDVTMSTSSPILDGGRLYVVNEKRRGQVMCLDRASGKTLWACDGSKGENVSLYDVGAFVLAFDAGGDLTVFEKVAAGLKETAKYEVADSAVWASPAISGQRLLVKGAETLTLWEVPSK